MTAERDIVDKLLYELGRRMTTRVKRRIPRGSGKSKGLVTFIVRHNEVKVVGPRWMWNIERGRGPADADDEPGDGVLKKAIAPWALAKSVRRKNGKKLSPSSLAFLINKYGTRGWQRGRGEPFRRIYSDLPEERERRWMRQRLLEYSTQLGKSYVATLRAAVEDR